MWERFKAAFKEAWLGCKIGLVIGALFGFALAKIYDAPRDHLEMAVYSYAKLGLLLGGFVGCIVKLVRLWRGRKRV